MTPQVMRLVIVTIVFLVFTIFDVLVNVEGGINPGLVTYISVTVIFHVVAFEAVLSDSAFLRWILWAGVIALSIAAFVAFDEWFAGPVTMIFLVVYTMALLAFLKNEFGEKRS